MNKNWGLKLAGIVVGAILGLLYYSNWGCTSGCAIRSSAKLMGLYGGVMGFLVVGLFDKKEKE